jgi:hypothetical protein
VGGRVARVELDGGEVVALGLVEAAQGRQRVAGADLRERVTGVVRERLAIGLQRAVEVAGRLALLALCEQRL